MNTTQKHNREVLIVEDDLILAMVLERMVERLDFNVLKKCDTGQNAIELVNELEPDLVLMDILLKDNMDGITAMHKIREVSPVPVIYITGNSDRQNIQRAKNTKFVDYLVKPIQLNRLGASFDKAFALA